MKTFLALLSLALSCTAGAADPDVQQQLVQYRCTICHADRETLAGPSYADIAQAYRGQKQAAALLAARIRIGARDGGLWHMPPHPEVSKSAADAMARYILTIKD
jgi:cytochrome c